MLRFENCRKQCHELAFVTLAFSFIGEESVAAGERSVLTDNPTWIIDPIDGTTNFVHRCVLKTVTSYLLLVRRRSGPLEHSVRNTCTLEDRVLWSESEMCYAAFPSDVEEATWAAEGLVAIPLALGAVYAREQAACCVEGG